MSTFLGGSGISGMYLGSNEISEMYLGSDLIYSSWPYKTLRVSRDGGNTWEGHGRPEVIDRASGLYSLFYNSRITNVEFPDSVTDINGFGRNYIRTIYFPKSVKRIRNSAFNENNLTHVEFPESLETIDGWAFRNNSLSEVRLSSRTTYVTGTNASFDSRTRIITY